MEVTRFNNVFPFQNREAIVDYILIIIILDYLWRPIS